MGPRVAVAFGCVPPRPIFGNQALHRSLDVGGNFCSALSRSLNDDSGGRVRHEHGDELTGSTDDRRSNLFGDVDEL